MTWRACVVQMPHGTTVEENLAVAKTRLQEAADAGARLVLLPEYFFAPPDALAAPLTPAVVRRMLQAESAALDLIIAANVVEGPPTDMRNRGVVYHAGELAFEQEKVHPMPREAASGIVGGARFQAARVADVPMGMLVCADVLYPEAARVLSLQGAELLLNPVMSPWRASDLTRPSRDAIFVARAYDSGAFVLKAGGFRKDGAHPVAGRSLIASPWGVLAKARDDFEAELLFADLDFDQLHAFRKGQQGFPARRPDAYRDLTDL